MTNTKEIFSLCNYHYILNKSLSKQKKLIKNTDLRNSRKENLLHFYIRQGGSNKKLIKKMMDGGHSLDNINSEGLSILQSLICNQKYNILYHKDMFDWLIEQNIPSGSNKFKVTKSVLLDALDNYHFSYKIMTKEYFEIIKKLFEHDMLQTELHSDTYLMQFNPGFYTNSVEILEWFDQNFEINWDIMPNSSISNQYIGYYNNPVNYKTIYNFEIHYNNEDVDKPIKWLVNKNPRYIYTSEYSKILQQILCYSLNYDLVVYLENLNILSPNVDEGDDGGDIDFCDSSQIISPIWKSFENVLLKYSSLTVKHKLMYIWALKNKKINRVHLGLIRRLCLTINSFKNFETVNHSTMLRHYTNRYNNKKINVLCEFPDDPDQTSKENELLVDAEEIMPFTKNQCLKIKSQIDKYLKKIK